MDEPGPGKVSKSKEPPSIDIEALVGREKLVLLRGDAGVGKSSPRRRRKDIPWGNKSDKNLCNSWELELRRTNPVGVFPKGKSPYGCFDMAGNVWEWCADWFDEKHYRNCPVKNPPGPTSGSLRVGRGGGWIGDAHDCACAFRDANHPADRASRLGFRLARSV